MNNEIGYFTRDIIPLMKQMYTQLYINRLASIQPLVSPSTLIYLGKQEKIEEEKEESIWD